MKGTKIALWLGALAFVFTVFSWTGCTLQTGGVVVEEEHKGGPPPHAPAHGYRAKHSYYYYPTSYVYFDMTRRVYFYMEGSVWRTTVSLPDSIRVKLGDHVTIDMDDDEPYREFDSHKKKYPPGQMKKMEKGKKKDKD
ncbi:MAG TPA: hypothetical protein VGA86_02320 [Desulfatiglandales bacterium]